MTDSITAGESSRPTKYGTSCSTCRRRKQRCDTSLPSCSRCIRAGEICVYEGNQRRLTAAQLYTAYNSCLRFLRSLPGTVEEGQSSEKLRSRINTWLEKHAESVRDDQGDGQSAADTDELPDSTSKSQERTQQGIDDVGGDAGGSASTVEAEEHPTAEVDELLMLMSINQEGQNGHFGVTSFLWQTPSQDVLDRLQSRALEQGNSGTSKEAVGQLVRGRRSMSQASPASVESTAGSAQRKARKGQDASGEVWITEGSEADAGDSSELGLLRANASMLGNWESLAFHKLELEYDHDTAKNIIHLLKTYFSWQYGLHCVIYRPVFLRDMALGGPYFNKFLLNVICTSALRFSDYHVPADGRSGYDSRSGTKTPGRTAGADYLSTAKLCLMDEMDKPSSVPTIQGLLLLGQRECSCGNLSQGWQYTGMAFRAMRDLGIHLNVSRLPIFGFGTLSIEDREIRRRLFWSAYTWDKIISLALGRYPTFNAFQNVSPGPIVDDTEDDDDWLPHYWDASSAGALANYPVHKALTTSNNKHFIVLSEIIQKIISRLYNGRPRIAQGVPFIAQMRDRLNLWFSNLPLSLKLDPSNLPEHCPPPHIFSTNVLYRATWILLYRMFLPNDLPIQATAPAHIAAEASRVCTAMAEEIHMLFQLYNKSFMLRNMTYTTSWSMYSAATINAIDFHSSDQAVSSKASPRLMFSLHVLERASINTPGIARSIDLIKQRLRSPRVRIAKRAFMVDDPADRSEKRITGNEPQTSSTGGPIPPSMGAEQVDLAWNDSGLNSLASSSFPMAATSNLNQSASLGIMNQPNPIYQQTQPQNLPPDPGPKQDDLSQFFTSFPYQTSDQSGFAGNTESMNMGMVGMGMPGLDGGDTDLLYAMAAMPTSGVGDAAWASNDWFEDLWQT